uniref:Reverse transcriptase domain-containing protein n=2 Tax=Physcomitrium patens TaxID=3218 RepID=A0A2K1KJH3_PHYPA|nr:hypothetical protein PHYPA_007588 [Physcomitrium patens]
MAVTLGQCLNQCAKYGISLNSKKYQFGMSSGKFLDHIVLMVGITTDPDKIKIIVELKQLDTVTGVRAFVGYISYYPQIIYLFTIICLLLTNLLKKPPTDRFIVPCWIKPFQVYVDASNVTIDFVLSQKDDRI